MNPLPSGDVQLRQRYEKCPVCDAPPGTELARFDCSGHPSFREPLPKVLTWLKCTNCGHIHSDAYWTGEGSRLLLACVHPGQMVGGDLDRKRALWSRPVQAVVSRLGVAAAVFDGKASWLDVGPGDGALVMTAAEFGFRAVGMDCRAEPVQGLRELGYQAVLGDFLELSTSEPFDVLSMADVLEHLPFPRAALRKANDFLKPGGILYVSCPNLDAASWRQMDRSRTNPYWIEMEHCHNFSRRLLCMLLQESGFEPEVFGISERYKAGMEICARKVAVVHGL